MGHEGLKITQYYVYYPLALLILGAGVLAAIRAGRGMSRFGRVVTAAGLVVLVVKTIAYRPANCDFNIFLEAGQRLLSGADPYADVHVANPPTAVPLFAAFAGLPSESGPVVWTCLNLILGVLLVPLAYLALVPVPGSGCARGSGIAPSPPRGEGGRTAAFPNGSLEPALAGRKPSGGVELPAQSIWALTAVVSVSIALHFQIDLGQLTTFEAVSVLLALACRARDWPLLAGVFLGLGTVKPHSMIPFLILFLRRRDLPTWVMLAVTTATLCLAGGSMAELSERLRADLDNIGAMAAPGGTNDYAFEGPFGHTIVGLDRAFYCLGLRDRDAIRCLQLAVLGLGGLWLVSLALRPRGYPPGAVTALVALYSVIFLYHRTYDTLILALPVVYTAWRIRTGSPAERRWSIAALAAQLLVLFTHPKLVEIAVAKLANGPAALERLGQAIALPYATWLTIVAMVCLTCGAAVARTEEPPAGAVGRSPAA